MNIKKNLKLFAYSNNKNEDELTIDEQIDILKGNYLKI